MQPFTRNLLAAVFLATAMQRIAISQQPSFQGIGDLAGGPFSSMAIRVSSDGATVAGDGTTGTMIQAIRWTIDGGMVGVGSNSVANSISGDGTRLVGCAAGQTACYWTSTNQLVLIGAFQSPSPFSSAYDVSADGLTIVGVSHGNPAYTRGFRWDAQNGMVDIGDLMGGAGGTTEALGISDDGSTIVGDTTAHDGNSVVVEAFRWTAQTGMVGLGFLSQRYKSTVANGASSSGNVVVGGGDDDNQALEAFRWTEQSGIVGLGHGSNNCGGGAFSVSGDGRIIVGRCGNASSGSDDAFIWDASHGIRNLYDLLMSLGVTSVADWWLLFAFDVSADGTKIVGYGLNGNGDYEGFIAVLPRAYTTCFGDANGDGRIDIGDLALLLSNFGQFAYPGLNGDVNQDGLVDLKDLAVVLSVYGATCP